MPQAKKTSSTRSALVKFEQMRKTIEADMTKVKKEIERAQKRVMAATAKATKAANAANKRAIETARKDLAKLNNSFGTLRVKDQIAKIKHASVQVEAKVKSIEADVEARLKEYRHSLTTKAEADYAKAVASFESKWRVQRGKLDEAGYRSKKILSAESWISWDDGESAVDVYRIAADEFAVSFAGQSHSHLVRARTDGANYR